MKNYKYGDEVLVRAKIAGCESSERCMLKVDRTELFVNVEDIIPIPDMTAEEAWKIAKKFNSLSGDALIEIFDTDDIPYIIQNLTIWQIKEKIEEWEQDKIEVGDVVEFEGRALLVTSILGEYCCGIDMNGIVYSEKKKYTKKTGRHIDIDKILKEIGDADA